MADESRASLADQVSQLLCERFQSHRTIAEAFRDVQAVQRALAATMVAYVRTIRDCEPTTKEKIVSAIEEAAEHAYEAMSDAILRRFPAPPPK